MVDRSTFEQYVQDALDHLFDPADLLVHPLTALLVPKGSVDIPGQALHRALRDAISLLKPPPDAPVHSPSWRAYRYLSLRYVEMMTIGQVASELGISPRQCRRDHHEAIGAVASILWDSYQHAPRAAGSDGAAVKVSTDPAYGPGVDLLDSEVGKIGSSSAGQIDVRPIVESAVATLGPLAAGKNVQLRVALPARLPPVVVDRTVLRQMLLELLLDAIDRGADGQIDLSVTTVADRVHLSVSVVQTVSSSAPVGKSAESEATRLTVSRRLAQLQGVGFNVESTESGIRVDLAIPCADAPDVLVVDDNADILHLYHHYLDGVFRVHDATSGDQALDLSRTIRPMAITLDVMMPSQDGWEVLQKLKLDPATADIPIIVCSVLRERELAMSLGAADFLVKPVMAEQLVSALQRCRATR